MKKRVKSIRAVFYFDAGTTTFRYYSDDTPANQDVGKIIIHIYFIWRRMGRR
jgi:hypothetical protein